MDIKDILDKELIKRNRFDEISLDKPDPLLIARNLPDELSILTCAIFAYGNAKQITKFLEKLPFDLNDRSVSEITIRNRLKGFKYRFQTEEDIVQWFLIMARIRAEEKKRQYDKIPKQSLLKKVFFESYKKENNVIAGILSSIDFLYSFSEGYSSPGLNFLIGMKNTNTPFKRWNMFLRWMVRKDELDLGYWYEIDKKDLIVPLDTHTFNLGKKFGLINRKTYDLKSAIELTESFKKFDSEDPVKYDFALYRLGQEKESF